MVIVCVIISYYFDDVILDIFDDGCGISVMGIECVDGVGYGLVGMWEWMFVWGGIFEVGSCLGYGFWVCVVIFICWLLVWVLKDYVMIDLIWFFLVDD